MALILIWRITGWCNMPHFGELTLQQIPFTHLLHFTMEQGVTDVLLIIIKAGCIPLPYRVERMAMSVDPAPGGADTVSFTLSNGVENRTITCTGAETSKLTTDPMDVDPLIQDLTLHYTQSAGGASDKATITICRRYR